jgi:porin
MKNLRPIVSILLLVNCMIMTFTPNSDAEDSSDLTGMSGTVSEGFLDSWSKKNYFTGNWGGYRDKLKNKGVDIFGYYDATFLGNPIGGEKKGIAYAGLLNIYLYLDFEKLLDIKGLRFRVSGSWASGRSLTEDYIGNFFQVSSIFNGREVRLYQLYLEQSLFDDMINVALGRLGTGDEFMTSPIFYNFVSLAFDQNPASILFNIPSFTVDPTSTWGARVKVRPFKEFYAMFGAYDSNPDVGKVGFGEFEPTFNGEAFLIGELGVAINTDEDSKGLPGNYKIGGYYDTSNFTILSEPDDKRRGSYGFYFVMDQMIYREGGPGSDQGLTPFATFTLAPSEDINTFPFFFSTGFVYEGLFRSRDTDTTSFGFSYGKVSKDLIEQDFEILMELTHIFNIMPWLSVQPDIQYVIHPGGSSEIPNALVLGLGLTINL